MTKAQKYENYKILKYRYLHWDSPALNMANYDTIKKENVNGVYHVYSNETDAKYSFVGLAAMIYFIGVKQFIFNN